MCFYWEIHSVVIIINMSETHMHKQDLYRTMHYVWGGLPVRIAQYGHSALLKGTLTSERSELDLNHRFPSQVLRG